MKLYWLRILLLSTFAFWATGAAKYTHEALEHHGRDASVDDDDDDDDSSATPAAAAVPAIPQDRSHQPAKQTHPCPVCQMLAAMVVNQSAPPVVPPLCIRLIGVLAIADHSTPTVPANFSRFARGPPESSVSI